nr:entry exclusion lipoprotein TrbK [Stenotrophomonas sp. MMGLT7]
METGVATSKGLLVGVLMGSMLAGCGGDSASEKKYEVSDETCTAEHWKTLPQGKSRDDLVAQCLRRGDHKPSEPKTW